MKNDDKAECVSAMLDFEISATIGARNMMRQESPSWRVMDAYGVHLIHFKNQLLKYKGGVFSPEFEMPIFKDKNSGGE